MVESEVTVNKFGEDWKSSLYTPPPLKPSFFIGHFIIKEQPHQQNLFPNVEEKIEKLAIIPSVLLMFTPPLNVALHLFLSRSEVFYFYFLPSLE